MTRALQSLIGQLVIALVAIALVAVIGLSALMNWQLERVVRDVHAESLLILSEGIARTVSFDAAGNVVLALPSDIAQRFARGTGRFRYLLLDAEGRTIMASHDQMKSMLHPGPIAEVEAFEYQDGTTELWGVALPLRSGDRLLQLQLAEDMSSAESILDQIPGRAFWPMGFGVLAVLVGASLVMLLAARHVLRPVRLASMQAEQIGPGSHIRGITVPRLPTEVEPLIRAVNGALDRLDGAYRRQREFSADVAHELRTPLTIMRTQADLLPDRALAQTLRRDIDGMIRLVNQLLDSADADRLEIGVDARADLVEIGRASCRERV